jgi:hypothetical protein
MSARPRGLLKQFKLLLNRREMRTRPTCDRYDVRIARLRASFRASPTIPENPMHDAPTNQNAGRYVPFKQEGWGIALFVVLLAAGAAGFATYVHKSTYRHPTDVRFQATGSSGSHE